MFNGLTNVVMELLNSGAEVDAPINDLGANAIGYACQYRRLEVARLLLQHGASLDQLDERGNSPGL